MIGNKRHFVVWCDHDLYGTAADLRLPQKLARGHVNESDLVLPIQRNDDVAAASVECDLHRGAPYLDIPYWFSAQCIDQ